MLCVVDKRVCRNCIVGTIIDVNATLTVQYIVFRKSVVKRSRSSDSKATVKDGVYRHIIKGGFVKLNSIVVVG
jgi:hypothetical protein